MFNNDFKNLGQSSLAEAAKVAMQDGEIRRQAESLVNEEFGVYSRKAVVREQLAAYDARLEEAYKCMKEGEKEPKLDMKAREKAKSDYSKMREKMVGKGKDAETTRKIVGEAKKLADKDYDKDGKVESPKDEVWGSRFRAAKMAGKMEETSHLSPKQKRMAALAGNPKKIDSSDLAALRAGKKMEEKKACYEEEQIDEISVGTSYSYSSKKIEKARKGYKPGEYRKSSKAELRDLGRAADRSDSEYYKKKGYKKVEEETDYSAQDRAPVTRDNKPSTPAQTNASTSGPSASDKAGLAAKIKSLKESKRVRKDIAKGGVTAPKEYCEPRHPNAGAITSVQGLGSIMEAWKAYNEAKKALEEGVDFDIDTSLYMDNFIAECINTYGSMINEHEEATVDNLDMFNEDYVLEALEEAYSCSAKQMKEMIDDIEEAAYSFSAAREGKDIGKKGKMFKKIASKAGKRYGSEERGKKVAGAVLAKLRAKHMKEAIGTSQYGTATGSSFGAIDKARNATSAPGNVPRPPSRPSQTDVNKLSRNRGLADSGSKYAGGKPHSMSTFKPSDTGSQASVQSRKTEKGWADPGRYENEAKSKTGSMQQIRQGKVLDTATTQLGRPSASSEKSTQSFLNKELGKTTANPQGPEASSPQTPQQRWDASRQASNQPSPGVAARTANAEVASGADKARDNSASVKKLMSMNESVQVGTNKYRIV